MNNEFALITEFNWGYRWGFNGLVNGLDYHGNKGIDIHAIHSSEVPAEYLEEAKRIYPNIYFYRVEDYEKEYPPPPNCGSRWSLEFYKYKLAKEVAYNYNAIVMMDCDYLCTGRIENYLELVVDKDLILTSNNWMDPPNNLNDFDEEFLMKSFDENKYIFPVMNSPCFLNPSANMDFLEKVFELGRIHGEDCLPFSQALGYSGKLSKTIPLPGILFFNPAYAYTEIQHYMSNNKRCYYTIGDKMILIHRHWWAYAEIDGEITAWATENPDPKREAMARRSSDLLFRECKLINTAHKLKIPWVG